MLLLKTGAQIIANFVQQQENEFHVEEVSGSNLLS